METSSRPATPSAKPASPSSLPRIRSKPKSRQQRRQGNRQAIPRPSLPPASSTPPSTSNNRIQTLHGSPNSRIVSTSPGEPDKVSTAHNLDVTFAPDGGVQKLIQTGDFQYHEASAKPDTGGREAFADVATYTPERRDAAADRLAARHRRRHDHDCDQRCASTARPATASPTTT